MRLVWQGIYLRPEYGSLGIEAKFMVNAMNDESAIFTPLMEIIAAARRQSKCQ